MNSPYAFSTDYPVPHYQQAALWHRFARVLKGVRASAYDCKEEALRWSLAMGTRALCFPATLDTTPAHDRGLSRLVRRMKGYGGPTESEAAAPERFPELEARTVYLDGRDGGQEEERVELLLHAPASCKGVRPRGPHVRNPALLPVGYLPASEAAWACPLLRQHLPLRFFAYDLTPGPVQRGGLSKNAEVCVVVAGAHEAGRAWIDVFDDRKSARAKRWTVGPVPAAFVEGIHESPCAGSRLEKVAEPSVEDWIREDIERRETCLSDLSSKDFWQVASRL